MACGFAVRRWIKARAAFAMAMLCLWQMPFASAASLSSKDVQLIAKVITFLDPPPAGGRIAIVYAGGSAAARTDAEAIMALFGDGVRTRRGLITAILVEASALAEAAGYSAVILAADTPGGVVTAAAKAGRIPCISADTTLVHSGACMIAVRSEPKVDITVNRAAARDAGVAFAPVFQLLIREL
jgi:hypothetical protein